MFFNGEKFIFTAIFDARLVVIEADIELPFRFSNVLYFAKFAWKRYITNLLLQLVS